MSTFISRTIIYINNLHLKFNSVQVRLKSFNVHRGTLCYFLLLLIFPASPIEPIAFHGGGSVEWVVPPPFGVVWYVY